MGRSRSCAVDKYIGTDFDYVKEVAEHIDTINDLGPVAGQLGNLTANLDDILKLADNLEEFQIIEEVNLGTNQLTVTLTKVIPSGMELFVTGPQVDGKRLSKDFDYTVSGMSITLKRTYPFGSKLVAVQAIIADKGTTLVYSDKNVFNRVVIPMGIGNVLKDKVEDGITLPPFLLYQGNQYLPTEPLPIEHTIKSNFVGSLPNGEIEISVNAGGTDKQLVLNKWNARALPQQDIIYLFQEGLTNTLIEPPKVWEPNTEIVSVTYHIKVDGIDYFPIKVPFTTAGNWRDDQVNWNEVRGRKPCNVDLTGTTTIPLCDWTTFMVLEARSPTNIVSFSNVDKYRKITLIPESNNITLVHSDSFLRLTSGSTLTLSVNSVYEFYIDHNGIARQVV